MDYRELQDSKNLDKQQLADKIGMDKSTFYRRIQANGDTFTLKEATDIVATLGLTPDEGMRIFFAHKVA